MTQYAIPTEHALNDLNTMQQWSSFRKAEFTHAVGIKMINFASKAVEKAPLILQRLLGRAVAHGIKISLERPGQEVQLSPEMEYNPSNQCWVGQHTWMDQDAKVAFYSGIQVLLKQIGYIACPQNIYYVDAMGMTGNLHMLGRQASLEWFIEQAEADPTVLGSDFNLISGEEDINGNVKYLSVSRCASWCMVVSRMAGRDNTAAIGLLNDAIEGILLHRLYWLRDYLMGAILNGDIRKLRALSPYSVRNLENFVDALRANNFMLNRQESFTPFQMLFYLYVYLNLTYRYGTLDNAYMRLAQTENQNPGRRSNVDLRNLDQYEDREEDTFSNADEETFPVDQNQLVWNQHLQILEKMQPLYPIQQHSPGVFDRFRELGGLANPHISFGGKNSHKTTPTAKKAKPATAEKSTRPTAKPVATAKKAEPVATAKKAKPVATAKKAKPVATAKKSAPKQKNNDRISRSSKD